jgi:hypothetical protein
MLVWQILWALFECMCGTVCQRHRHHWTSYKNSLLNRLLFHFTHFMDRQVVVLLGNCFFPHSVQMVPYFCAMSLKCMIFLSCMLSGYQRDYLGGGKLTFVVVVAFRLE